ncbi:MAG: hypothetical protein JWP25_8977 [Bradyrhizobium sp.]|nr:hypothetical protein [Bradyrhizobium sp.]
MTPDEERRLLRLLEFDDALREIVQDNKSSKRFWLKVNIWAKTLATLMAGAAALRYMGDWLRGVLR